LALTATRIEVRVALSDVDHDVTAEETLIVALHPSETPGHLCLRVLGWCLIYGVERGVAQRGAGPAGSAGLAFGPGLSDGDAADLWAHDLTGQLTLWVECGAVTADKLKRVVHQHQGLEAHVVLDDERRVRELRAELEASALRRPEAVHLWVIPGPFVAALAVRLTRRQRWVVTLVGEHLYVDADGEPCDAPVTRARLPPRT
jgi:uncharacterized protein YaeQ